MWKKALIYNASIKVMALEGYYNTKVQAIADEANISVGTIYNYFQSKEEILDFIFKVDFERRINFLNELENNDLPILSKIRIFLEFYFNEFLENPDKMKVISQEMVLFIKFMSDSTKDLLIKLRDDFGKLIEKGQQSGEIRDIDVYSITTFIIHSILSVIFTPQFKEGNEEYNQLKGEFIEFIINGLKK